MRVIDDPLSGRKSVTYTTDTKVVYGLDEVPQYDGSGDINYTGRSVGKISSITLDNLGSNYKKLPIIRGVVPADGYKAEVTAVRNATTNEIEAITISDPGQGYSKPELVVASGEGTGLRTVVDTENGKVTQVRILNGGTFTETPLLILSKLTISYSSSRKTLAYHKMSISSSMDLDSILMIPSSLNTSHLLFLS